MHVTGDVDYSKIVPHQFKSAENKKKTLNLRLSSHKVGSFLNIRFPIIL